MPSMTSKLICILKTAMHRTMLEKQYYAVITKAKFLMKLAGLEEK